MNDSFQAQMDRAVELVEQQRLTEAHDLYEHLCNACPDDAQTWFRFGAVNGMLGDLDAVVRCSRKAIELDPLMGGAWKNLGNALERQNLPDAALRCYWEMAQRMAEAKMRPEALYALERLLALPIKLPDKQLTLVYFNRGTLYAQEEMHLSASEDFRKAVALQPGNPENHYRLAEMLVVLSSFHAAYDVYRRLIELRPGDAESIARMSEACERIHRLDEAEKYAEQARDLDPDSVTATVTLSKLDRRAGRLEQASERLKVACAKLSSPLDEPHLYYELGRVNDRMGRYPQAFEFFGIANRGIEAEPATREFLDMSKGYIDQLESTPGWYPAERLKHWPVNSPDDGLQNPVFLVGHPRSGTTLTEQVLSAHPEIMVTDEKPLLRLVTSRLSELAGGTGRVPEYLDNLSPQQLSELRADYWKAADRMLGTGARSHILVDKYPLNVIDLGVIQRIFPTSPIIMALRDPRDVCLSCFMQYFKPNRAMVCFFGFGSTVRHYVLVMELWLHFRSVTGLRWIESRYEDLVTDFEASARRLIAFLR